MAETAPASETAASGPGKKIVLLCDGTWCGKETDTKTNIHYLAELIWDKKLPAENERKLVRDGLVARYADGVGLGSTFLDYLFNGATANDIAKECTDAYEYIVKNFKEGDEIWMFGLSRGAFTARCIGGMINNCGIVKKRDSDDETTSLCNEVYRIYRSSDPRDKPDSKQMKRFRKSAACHQVTTPVKFMGLFDTVGSLGIPKFSGGIGFEYPEFHDQVVSTAVERVYHAVSLHDRLCVFQPCLTFRKEDRKPEPDVDNAAKSSDNEATDPGDDKAESDVHNEGAPGVSQAAASGGDKPLPEFEIQEKWFPGAHYDLGRQRFKFLRTSPVDWEEKFVSVIPNFLSGTVEPNHVLADLVLDWMLSGIQLHDTGVVVQDIKREREAVQKRILDETGAETGSGDVYDRVLDFIPLSAILGGAIQVLGKIGSIIGSTFGPAAILQTLNVMRDRRIPDDEAKIYRYDVASDSAFADSTFATPKSISKLGKLDRYKSRTHESFQLYLEAERGA